MPRRLHALLFAAAGFAVGAPGMTAAEMSPLLKDPSPPPAAVAPGPAVTHAISPAVAEKLAAATPKYTPPAAPAPQVEATPDLREVDKPRNGIVRLPSYLVQEEKLPAFKERELLTPQGRLKLAYQRHPGLNFGNIWIFRNDGIALMMLEEEERLERRQEFYDLASLLPRPEAKKAKALADEAFSRADFSGR
jgi:hypothetical protein